MTMAKSRNNIKNLRILIVDDSTLHRKLIKEALGTLPETEIVGYATNGNEALLQAETLQPDVITLDIEMPGMDGIEVLSRLQHRNFEGEVIIVSCHTREGAPLTIKALELGAFDFILKPEHTTLDENLKQLREMMAPMLAAIARRKELKKLLKGVSVEQEADFDTAAVERNEWPTSSSSDKSSRIIVIGISTGGPKVLREIIPQFPPDLKVPILIIQHMPEGYTSEFAKNLDGISRIAVKEAESGELIQPETVYIAPGGRQLKVGMGTFGRIILITDDPPENNCRPSVDYCFRSVAKLYGAEAIGVVMTGMGSDGAIGSQLLKRCGAKIIVQDEATSVVFGMPKSVIDSGVADMVCPTNQIVNAINLNLRR